MPSQQQIDDARQCGRDADVLMAEFLGVSEHAPDPHPPNNQDVIGPAAFADPMEEDAPENHPPSRAQLCREAASNCARKRQQCLEDQIAEGIALGLDEDEVMDMLNEGEECPEPAPRRCAANLSIWRGGKKNLGISIYI